MKKRFILILSAIMLYMVYVDATSVFADTGDLILSDITKVKSENTDTCYVKVTDKEKNSGNYSLHLFTDGDWLEISQDYKEPLVAGTYTLTWYAKGTGILWFYSGWEENTSTYMVDSAEEQANGWTKYEVSLELDGNGDTLFAFHKYAELDCYIDDISLIDTNGVNYIIDGGFEDVKLACDVHTWDNGVITKNPTVSAEGVKTYTCTVCEFKRTEPVEKLVPPYTYGDLNDDSTIDVKDVIAMRQYIAGGYDMDIIIEAANVNTDETVDVKDVIHLRQFIAGGYGVELG